MKTNTIFILINELEESSFQRMPGQKMPLINFQQLIGANKSGIRKFCMEDIFIGATAEWSSIKERIEEYLELSMLREGKLEIIYYSSFDAITRMYTNSADDYFHFYDACIHRSEIKQLVESFPSTFECSFINRSNENLDMLDLNIELSDQERKSDTVRFDFLKMTNVTNNLVLA